MELSPRRKRQATLIYHFASLEYLKRLLPRVEDLILYADALVRGREHLDKYLMSERWGARDTSANWSTYGFPALVSFRESTLWHIQARARDVYGVTGANQCARMLAEYSLMWMTPEQESQFQERFQEVYKYASRIDDVTERNSTMGDYTYWVVWNEQKDKFPRLPKFHLRTDIEGESGKVPPRTGVYVPQDDPWGTPQFAWGGDPRGDGSRWYGGYLGEAVTLNALGIEAMESVGRSHIWPWDDGAGAVEFLHQKNIRNEEGDEVRDESDAIEILHAVSYGKGAYDPSVIGIDKTTRPCKWHYVELLEGEYEDASENPVQSVPTRAPGMNAEGAASAASIHESGNESGILSELRRWLSACRCLRWMDRK